MSQKYEMRHVQPVLVFDAFLRVWRSLFPLYVLKTQQ